MAHIQFSDTHVLAIGNAKLNQFLNKRITGAANLVLNRSRHYRTEVFEAVLDAISQEQADHVVCTGDLVNLALEAEFIKVRSLLASHFEPGQLTIVPGNHDYYVKENAMERGHSNRSLVIICPTPRRESPRILLKVVGDIAIIGLCSAIEQPFFFAGEKLEQCS